MKKILLLLTLIYVFIVPVYGQRTNYFESKFKSIKSKDFKKRYCKTGIDFFNISDTTLLSSNSYLPSEYDKIIDDFYIGKYEVSNAEYVIFEHWVYDSIYREMLFRNSKLSKYSKSKWGTYVNYPTQLNDGLGYFKLNWNTPLPLQKSATNYLNKLKKAEIEIDWGSAILEKVTLLYTHQGIDLQTNILRGDLDQGTSIYREFENKSAYPFLEPQEPIVGISYEQAEAFCDWLNWIFTAYYDQLSKKEKSLFPKECKFRLPSADEWEEAACMNMINLNYIFQNSFGKYCANYGAIFSDRGMLIKNLFEDGYTKLAPINAYEPGEIGLYNLHGNASEWTNTKPILPELDISKLGISYFVSFQGKDSVGINNEFQNYVHKIDSIFIEDPVNQKIHLVKQFGQEHIELLNKRKDFFQVKPGDSKDSILSKFFNYNSISTEGLNAFKKRKQKQEITMNNENLPDGVIDGVEIEEFTINRSFDTIITYYYNNELGELVPFLSSDMKRLEANINAFIHDQKVLKINKHSDTSILSTMRIVKGGSWNSPLHFIAIPSKEVYPKKSLNIQIGFRVAVEMPKSALK